MPWWSRAAMSRTKARQASCLSTKCFCATPTWGNPWLMGFASAGSRSDSGNEISAIDREDRTRDEGSRIGAEERDNRRDLVRVAEAPHRGARQEPLSFSVVRLERGE